VGLKRGPLSLVSTIEVLLGRNSSGYGLEVWEHGRGDPLRWLRDALYPQKLVLTSSTSGGRPVRSRIKATEFLLWFLFTIDGWTQNEDTEFGVWGQISDEYSGPGEISSVRMKVTNM
jgi:hypothetical protein